MTPTAACALQWVGVVLLAAACIPGADDNQEPGSADQPGPAASTSREEPTVATGTPAPGKGERGYNQLPTCHGRATLLGTAGEDRIVGTRAEDVIVSFGGNDHVTRLRKGDRVCTGTGDDTVSDIDHWQVGIYLGPGDDRVTDAQDLAVVRGSAGDDLLILPITAVAVGLGPGSDILRVVPSGPPRFPFNIAYNSPCPDYVTAVRSMRVNLRRGWARGQGRDRLVNVHCVKGSRFGDTIVGSGYADDIDVRAGSDEVWSLDGNDVVYDDSYPGVGDIFHLGAGNDSAMSGGGPDRVYGESGNDFVETSYGADYLEGGGGADVLHASYRCDGGNSGGAGTADGLPNEVFGGPGNDHLTGDLGNDRIDGGSGIDEGHGGHEDRRIDWIESLERITVCETPF
jgi:Ca2+-binding RTX toxin-like protein